MSALSPGEEAHAMKILVVDDHALLREAMCAALRELQGDAAVFEASDSREATQIAKQHADLDLILLDLGLPDQDGFDLLAELRARDPTVSIVVLSALQDRDSIVRALDLGAVGFIPKSASRKVILGALQLIFSGGIYIPPQAISHLARPLAQASPAQVACNGAGVGRPADLGLTKRQTEVLALLMCGKSNKAISRALNLAEPTTKNHVRAILKALRVQNRTEAVVAVGDLNWDPRPVLKP
jgi:DNA-binding NarL/FixJ family response regulator